MPVLQGTPPSLRGESGIAVNLRHHDLNFHTRCPHKLVLHLVYRVSINMFACSIVPLFRQLDDVNSRYPSGEIQDPLPSRREVRKLNDRSWLALGRMASAASVATTAITRINGRDWSVPAFSHSPSSTSVGKVSILRISPSPFGIGPKFFPMISLPYVLSYTKRGLRLPSC